MAWSAADVALVITTATTALTAVTAIALPLLTQWWTGRATKKAAIYEGFFQPLMFIVENASRVSDYALDAKMSYALLSAGLSAGDLTAGKKLAEEYHVARRKLELLAKRHGVDVSEFDLVAFALSVCEVKYNCVDGKLIEMAGDDLGKKFNQRRAQALKDLTNEAKHVLDHVDRIRP